MGTISSADAAKWIAKSEPAISSERSCLPSPTTTHSSSDTTAVAARSAGFSDDRTTTAAAHQSRTHRPDTTGSKAATARGVQAATSCGYGSFAETAAKTGTNCQQVFPW